MAEQDKEFEIALACYKEHSESFRALNNHLWQIPVLAMTLTGGLWLGVDKMNMVGKEYLLLLAALSDFGFIIVLKRTRFIMEKILEKLKAFSEKHHVEAKGEYFWQKPNCVVNVYSSLLLIAGVISFISFWKMANICS